MRFIHNDTLLFTAPINENNTAFLDGTADKNTESASYISTLPLSTLPSPTYSALNLGGMVGMVGIW